MAKILLLGGGNVLSLLAKKLHTTAEYRDQFIITSRREEQIQIFKDAGYQAFKLDILDANTLKLFFQHYPSLEVIVDSVPPIFTDNKSSLDESLSGVANLVSVLKNYPLRRLIYLSTTGVYGSTAGELVTEDSPLNPLSVRGLARLKSEELYQKLAVDVCALRIAGITSGFHNPKVSLLQGTYPLIDQGERYSNRIHIEDLVEVVLRTLDLNQKLPKAINIADGVPLKTKDLIASLQQRYQFTYPKSISYEEAKTRGWHTLLGNQQVSNQLLLDTFGDIIKFKGTDWL